MEVPHFHGPSRCFLPDSAWESVHGLVCNSDTVQRTPSVVLCCIRPLLSFRSSWTIVKLDWQDMLLLLYHTQTALLILTRLSAFPRRFVGVQGGKNLAPRLTSSTSLSPCIGSWVQQILNFWADGLAVGLVDLLTSLRNICLFYPLFSLFYWKWVVGGKVHRSHWRFIPYHINSHCFFQHNMQSRKSGPYLRKRSLIRTFWQKWPKMVLIWSFFWAKVFIFQNL